MDGKCLKKNFRNHCRRGIRGRSIKAHGEVLFLYGVVVFVCGLKNGSRGNFSVLDKLRNVFHVESNSEFLSALEKYQERKDLNSLYMFEEYSEIRSRYYRRPFDNDCESFIGV